MGGELLTDRNVVEPAERVLQIFERGQGVLASSRTRLSREHVGKKFHRISELLYGNAQPMSFQRAELFERLALPSEFPATLRQCVGGMHEDWLLAPQPQQIIVAFSPRPDLDPFDCIQDRGAKAC